MKFSINSKILLSRLVASGKAINNRPTISILGCFLFSLEESESDIKTLSITASDVDNTVISRVGVSAAEGSGKVCIDAKRITELLKSMPDCPISFNIDEESKTVIICHPKGKYNLSGLSANEYPLNDKVDPNTIVGSFSLPASQVISAFDKVSFAVGNDEIRPQMKGILWDIKPDAITFVATDTHVLAKYRSTQTAPGVETSFILPGQSLSLIRAFIGKQAQINVTVTNKIVVFEGADFKVLSTLLNGNYPNYNRVIPQNQPIIITVDRNDFADAINRVSIFADNQNSLLRFKISTDRMDAIAQDLSYNVGGEECIACEYVGNDAEIGFNSSYLKGIINVLNTQKIVIKILSHDRPGVFIPQENDEYGELTLLCMPVTINVA